MKIDRRVRLKEFSQLLSVSRTKFYKMMEQGHIIQPHRPSPKDIFWYESDVRDKVEEFKGFESENV